MGSPSFFRNYFVNDDLYAAVMVWRFFTYYLVVIAGALMVVVDQFLYRRKQMRETLASPRPVEELPRDNHPPEEDAS